MDDLAQHMLSGTSRPPVRDYAPVTNLAQAAGQKPSGYGRACSLPGPCSGRGYPFGVRAVRAPDGPPLINSSRKSRKTGCRR